MDLCHPGNFVTVFRQMCLHPRVRVLFMKLTRQLELLYA